MDQSWSVILGLISGLAMAYFYLRKYYVKQACPTNVQGNMGWPLVGETLAFLKPHKTYSLGNYLQEHCERYGKVFKSQILGYPTIVSCDYELSMFVLKNEGKLFRAEYPKVMRDILGKFSTIFASGDLHKKLRKVFVGFTTQSQTEPAFLNCVEMMSIAMLDSWKNCKEVVFYQHAKRFTMNVMLKHLLDIDPEHQLASKILENFDDYMRGFVSFPLPFPGTAYTKAMKAKKRVSSIIKQLILERRKKIDEGVGAGGDILSVILSNESLSHEEILSGVLDLIFGGYETTAKLLSLIIYFLDQAPNVTDKLKEEHQGIRKSKADAEPLSFEDYKQMEFTNYVIYEALRLGNVVKFLHRQAVEDVKFKEYFIPAGWKVLPILSGPHLDPTLHENPLEFNPWRWSDNETSKKVAPFGGGTRLCPGAALAKVEASLFLHHLVLNYRWKAKPDDPPIAFPFVEFTEGLVIEIEHV